jgi:hypothetical protein
LFLELWSLGFLISYPGHHLGSAETALVRPNSPRNPCMAKPIGNTCPEKKPLTHFSLFFLSFFKKQKIKRQTELNPVT